ncbi:MAG TPA: hypothetical protein VHI52_19395 [Verrucomicrobiae bacterium]|nr:hypothetical protein [Verrucomicrobiae bacterium]
MSRARSILITVVPVLVLLGSLDCATGSFSPRFGRGLSQLAPAPGRSKQNQAPPDASSQEALLRSSRRLSAPLGHGGFNAPGVLSLPHGPLPALAINAAHVPIGDPGLAQSWRFHLRAAAQPRAPSLAS